MATHPHGRPTVELHHDALDKSIQVSPGAARVLKASGWHEPSEESPEDASPAPEEATEPVAEFISPEEDY